MSLVPKPTDVRSWTKLKPVPVIVTVASAPAGREAGVIEVITGAGEAP
jgi:hypothetical protein